MQFQSNNSLSQQLAQVERMVQQLVQQTQQSSMQYQQLLQQEQSNAQALQQLAQREQHAAQVIQTALQGHQTAIQQLNQITGICNQISHSLYQQQQSPVYSNMNNQSANFSTYSQH